MVSTTDGMESPMYRTKTELETEVSGGGSSDGARDAEAIANAADTGKRTQLRSTFDGADDVTLFEGVHR